MKKGIQLGIIVYIFVISGCKHSTHSEMLVLFEVIQSHFHGDCILAEVMPLTFSSGYEEREDFQSSNPNSVLFHFKDTNDLRVSIHGQIIKELRGNQIVSEEDLHDILNAARMVENRTITLKEITPISCLIQDLAKINGNECIEFGIPLIFGNKALVVYQKHYPNANFPNIPRVSISHLIVLEKRGNTWEKIYTTILKTS